MKKIILTVIFTALLLFFAAACSNATNGDILDSDQKNNPTKNPDPGKNPDPDEQTKKPDPVLLGSGDLSIHFLELGNRLVGDCVYINYGEVDILIDAGSEQSSASTIMAYLNKHMQDEKIEFVIATHAHRDHIGALVNFGNVKGILMSYEIETLIDFPRTNISPVDGEKNYTATYKNYVDRRKDLKDKGTNLYTALECYNEINGAKRVYNLDAEGNVKLEILYNYYYENDSHEENDYSVCVKIIQGEDQYIFTGDMEKDGEDRMVRYYAENHGGLGQCILYKGGHHGSNTSSNEDLMAEIKPKYICVCTCAGTTQYTTLVGGIFPTQNFINRIAPYTDAVYITTFMIDYTNNIYESFNGDIVFLVSDKDGKISVTGSNNDLKLKETQWFKDNRKLPDAWKDDKTLNTVLLPAEISMYPRP